MHEFLGILIQFSPLFSIIYIFFIEILYSGRCHGLDTTNDIDFVFLCSLLVII